MGLKDEMGEDRRGREKDEREIRAIVPAALLAKVWDVLYS